MRRALSRVLVAAMAASSLALPALPAGAIVAPAGPAGLLLTEIVVTPTAGEFIEIHNPTGATIDLSDVYVTDATFAGGGTYYYNVVTGSNAGGGGFGDFHARFPAGATIAPGEYQTVSLNGSDAFSGEYAVSPTYELFEDGASSDAVPDMREATSGSINAQGGLTNSGEVVVLYHWDGATDLVQDLDYVIWGDTAEAVDKSGVAIDGPDADTDPSAYAADTALGSQEFLAPHDFGSSSQRLDLAEGAEVQSGGNGIGGSDETSEDLTNTWTTGTPSPNAAYVEPPPPPDYPIVVNELLADPASGDAGDANGDGTRDGSEDEFVELVNTSDATIDLSGASLSDGAGERHVFADGTVLRPGCAIVVFGGGTVPSTLGGSEVVTASVGFLGLNNGGDSVTLTSGSETIATASYGSEGGNDESLVLSPEVTGETYVGHSTVATTAFSPGTKADTSTFCDVTTIEDVQGTGDASPLEDQAVAGVTGVVTHRAFGAFWIQAEGDDDAASDGVPVTVKGFPSVSVGDLVVVDGVVDEAFGRTEIDSTQVITISSDNALPAPIAIDLPVASMDYWETIEGMRVSLPSGLVATDVYNAARFGEVWLAESLLTTPTQTMAPGAAAAAKQDLNDRSKVLLDDNDGRQYMEINWIDEFLRRGDTAGAVTGVVDYGFGNYRVQPSDDVTFTSANSRPAGPPTVSGELKASAFNVLNYFTTVDDSGAVCGPNADQGCRGADSAEELARQTDKIVAAITEMDVDIIGLMEIENAPDNAPEQALVDALNAVEGAGTYDFIAAGPVGSDAIRVGLLYKPSAVTPIGDHAILDSSVDPDFNDDKNRAVLAQTFRDAASGNTLTIAVNHLKSKGSDCDDLGDPDTGDGQGNCNLTRTAAAKAQVEWLDDDPTGQDSDHVLVLGDLNAYRMEDPVKAFTDEDYVDVVAKFAPDSTTYVFFGADGSLDHALANEDLAEFVVDADVWNINAAESNGTDYNIDEFKDDDVYFTRPAGQEEFRSSDHDPVIVGITLPSEDDQGEDDDEDSADDDDEEFEADLAAGETLTTDVDGDGAGKDDPIEVSVRTPTAGKVSLKELSVAKKDRDIDGYRLLGVAYDVEAPDASASDPLVLTFTLDSSVLEGATAEDIVVFRNGVAVEACASGDGIAAPDPCLASAEMVGDDAVLTVLTSKASVWTFGVAVLPATGVDSLPLGLLALAVLALGGLAVTTSRRRELA